MCYSVKLEDSVVVIKSPAGLEIFFWWFSCLTNDELLRWHNMFLTVAKGLRKKMSVSIIHDKYAIVYQPASDLLKLQSYLGRNTELHEFAIDDTECLAQIFDKVAEWCTTKPWR